ncbi:MAG: 16S rRNA (adenine(1518)-N(6)/adenine(1519)-N(6))-dimethyltransferase RsmA [Dehalococcoidia bacterium]
MHPAPKKSLGQHFLTDRNILGAVADAAEVGPGDTVVEVGPGRGTLTTVLAERAARVIALELDAELVAQLRQSMPANVDVRPADARAVAPSGVLGECVPYKLVGNLPYYAALPILRVFLESDCRPAAAAVLVQKEVASQMCARPGSMSLVSLAVQLFGEPRIIRLVRPGAFNPPPKVTSAIVGIRVYAQPAEGIQDTNAFFRLVRAGFSAPRKQLRNALANGLGVPARTAEALLSAAEIDPSARAETLSLAEWASLYRAWGGT